MNIRLANKADLKIYAKLLQTTYQSAYTNEEIGLSADCFSKEIFSTEHTQRYLKSHLINTEKQKTWLAFENSRLVGSITVVNNNDKQAELFGFYVHPDFQGRGIGQKLYQKAVDFAGERDLLLDIYVHNVKTIKMYKKWGWGLDESRGEKGYFFRHWPEWPEGLRAKCMYMVKKKAS